MRPSRRSQERAAEPTPNILPVVGLIEGGAAVAAAALVLKCARRAATSDVDHVTGLARPAGTAPRTFGGFVAAP